MELFFGVITGLIILVLLVVVHEFGHAVVARRNGVIVEEFGIGFPPRAWGRKLKNGVLFSLNWLPLGGFVKLQGEHDSARKKGDYGAATFWQKTRILLAGVLVNWVVAALLLTILALTGLPKVLPDQFSVQGDTTTVSNPLVVTAVSKDSPAEKAGLKARDSIIRFNGQAVPSSESLQEATKVSRGKEIEIIYSRDGSEQRTVAVLRTDNIDNQGFLGIGTGQQSFIRSSWSAPIVGFVTTLQFTKATFEGLGGLVANLATGLASQLSFSEATRAEGGKDLALAGDSVGGPLSILGILFPAAQQAGLTQLVFMTAIISLTLAVMNVLPIPALDGGRWFTMAIFRLLQRPLTKEREESIQTAGFLTLMALVVLVTYLDVTKIIK